MASIGEVWRISHTRKGAFTIRILSNPANDFFDAELIEGSPETVSISQRLNPTQMGETMTMRTSFITFLEQIPTATV
jgi:hypothetical protein